MTIKSFCADVVPGQSDIRISVNHTSIKSSNWKPYGPWEKPESNTASLQSGFGTNRTETDQPA